MSEQQEIIFITKKCCHECFFFSSPQGLTQQQSRQMIKDTLEQERFPECLIITVARRCGYQVPALCCCYPYFYQYWERLPVLTQAMQQGKIRFFDIQGLPGLRESGLFLYGKKPWS